MTVRIFQSGESTGVQKIFSENLDRSLPSDSIHASLRSSIQLLFLFYSIFFSFQAFFLCHSVRFVISFILYRVVHASIWIQYSSKWHEELSAVNRRKAMADLRVSQLETREDWLVCVCVFGNFLIIKKLARNRKFLVFLSISIQRFQWSQNEKNKKRVNNHQNLWAFPQIVH